MQRILWLVLTLLLVSCVGIERGGSSCMAQGLGADWIVVQYKLDGTPLNCWMLEHSGVASESSSDGIFWKSPEGHLVHLSGHYNYVQVTRGDFKDAAVELGIDPARCKGGRYLKEAPLAAE